MFLSIKNELWQTNTYELNIMFKREGVQHQLVEYAGYLTFRTWFYSSLKGVDSYLDMTPEFVLSLDTRHSLQITYQDFICAHMTDNWNCSMRDLEIYYNLYLSYKGIITKAELFEIVDKILG